MLIPPKLKLIIAVSVTGYALMHVGGCALGQTAGGDPVIGIPIGHGNPGAIGAAAGTIAGCINPALAVPVGTGVSAIAALLWGAMKSGDAKAAAARHEGENTGWDMAVGKPAQAAPNIAEAA